MSRSSLGRAADWVWNPAGPDDQLALACKDIEAGRFGMASQALRACTWAFEVRSRRSALLASVAAGVDAVDHWVAEEPSNPDALLLAARTAVVRARRAVAAGSEDARLARHAQQLCRVAAAAHPADPSPWVALLMLAEAVGGKPLTLSEGYALYREQRSKRPHVDAPARHAAGRPWSEQVAAALRGSASPASGPVWTPARTADAFEELLAQGPWDLMFEVWERDPLCREAYHWMVDCLAVHDAHQFALVVSMGAPATAAVQLLPLAANLAEYRWLSASGAASGPERAAADVWASKALHGVCVELFFGWFKAAREANGPVADFSLLAHALAKVGEQMFAVRVLEAMKPFGSTYPWSVTGGDGAREFLRVAEQLGVSPPRALSAWEHRELHR
jgi:hypothetical protein